VGGAVSDRSIENLLASWSGASVITQYDHETGAWIIIAVHSAAARPAIGGTRMKRYPDLADAMTDALGLSEAMTSKWAVARFPIGGGKTVIAVPPDLTPEARRGLLLRYGALLRQLGGLYETGPDVGTSSEDMDVIAETGDPYVHARTTGAGGSGDPGIATALGVFHGIAVTARAVFGDASLAGRSVLVQGTGHVGRDLIARLVEAGANVSFSEVDAAAIAGVRQEFGIRDVPAGAVYDTPCDIFAPCALGGILNEETIPRLRCRAVAGSANNQLGAPEDAERLQARGILYAPDFVINMGGALAGAAIEVTGKSRAEAEEQVVRSVTEALDRIYSMSKAERITTVQAAERLAREWAAVVPQLQR
jgi:glutamate dehydrogenase/leucine dehydrogenase